MNWSRTPDLSANSWGYPPVSRPRTRACARPRILGPILDHSRIDERLQALIAVHLHASSTGIRGSKHNACKWLAVGIHTATTKIMKNTIALLTVIFAINANATTAMQDLVSELAQARALGCTKQVKEFVKAGINSNTLFDVEFEGHEYSELSDCVAIKLSQKNPGNNAWDK